MTAARSHLKAQLDRKYDSCFGLAEQMLRAISKGEFEQDLGKGFEDDLVVSSIKIPVGERGIEKIASAAQLAMGAINQQLIETEHPSIENGLLEGSVFIKDNMVQLRLDSRFKPSTVHYGDAQEGLRDVKKIFEQVDNPVHFHDGAKKTDRFYWMGPFGEENGMIVAELLDTLLTFHQTNLPVESEKVDGEFYFKMPQPQMKQFLAKEGLAGRVR